MVQWHAHFSAAYPQLDIIRVQDTRQGIPDNKVLEWAATENRILLTHDVNTMPAYAYARIEKGLPMPGVIEVDQFIGIGVVLEYLRMIIEATQPDEWANRGSYIPF